MGKFKFAPFSFPHNVAFMLDERVPLNDSFPLARVHRWRLVGQERAVSETQSAAHSEVFTPCRASLHFIARAQPPDHRVVITFSQYDVSFVLVVKPFLIFS